MSGTLGLWPSTLQAAGAVDANSGLVYIRIAEGRSDIWQLRRSDGASRALIATPEREERWPCWSAQAGRLAFLAESRGEPSRLVLWGLASGEHTLQVGAARETAWPVWSPKHSELVFAFRGGKPPAGLMRWRPDEPAPALIAASGARDFFFRPSYAPDGRQLVAQRRSRRGGGSQLWLRNTRGEWRALTRGRDGEAIKPRFEHDGSALLFSRRSAARGPGEIVRLELAGAERILYAQPTADDHSPAPSPSRDEFAFVSDRDGPSQIYLGDAGQRTLRRLAVAGRHAFAPHWSPDGELLVVTTSPAAAGIPRLADAQGLAGLRIAVLDRSGRILLDAPGMMPDWMPAWR